MREGRALVRRRRVRHPERQVPLFGGAAAAAATGAAGAGAGAGAAGDGEGVAACVRHQRVGGAVRYTCVVAEECAYRCAEDVFL